MKITNKELLKKLAEINACPTEKVYNANLNEENVVVDNESEARRVLVDDVSDEEIFVALQVEQLETLRSIKSMLKFFTILTVVGLVLGFIVTIGGLG